MSTPISVNGKVEFKGDGTISSTFTLSDGKVLNYSGAVALPDIYAVAPVTCDAVLTYTTPGAPGEYSWTVEPKGDKVIVTVLANAGNTIVIDVPKTAFVQKANPSKLAAFKAEDFNEGSFTLH